MAYKKKTKKVKRQVDSAVAHIKSTFNNTLVSITTMDGDVLMRNSAGSLDLKVHERNSICCGPNWNHTWQKKWHAIGIRNVEVNMQGPGSGRDSVVRSLQASGFNVSVLRDVTPLPHNGCRAPKKRRV